MVYNKLINKIKTTNYVKNYFNYSRKNNRRTINDR